MIYQRYNFVDTYSNASGNRKNSMVLGELGKCISREPKAIINALKDAGVKVPSNPSKRDLVRLILANRQNRALVQNLSVLITANATANESFSNVVDDELTPLPLLKPTPITLPTYEIKGAKSDDKGGFLQKVGDFFQKRKEGKQSDPTKAGTAEKESAFRRFADWFTKNRDTIGQVANTLNNSLGSANQNNIPTGDGGGGAGDGGNGGAEQTWIQKNKTIVVIGLIAIAGGIYFYSKRKGKK